MIFVQRVSKNEYPRGYLDGCHDPDRQAPMMPEHDYLLARTTVFHFTMD